MNILVIGQYYPPDVGGGHRRAFNAIKGLVEKGHSIELVTAIPHYPLGETTHQYRRKLVSIENSKNNRILRVWMPPIAHRGFSRRLLMYLFFSLVSLVTLPMVKRPDVIWTTSPSVFSSFPATIFSIVKRAPVVRNVDDLWPETAFQLGFLSNRQKKIGEAAARLSYILCKALTPISTAYCNLLVRKYKVHRDRLHVAEVGVDLSDYPKEKISKPKKNDKFEIIYSGILGVGYDFDVILEAASLLQNEPVHFLIRGIGEMEAKIREQIKQKNLTNVELSTEFLNRDVLIELLIKSNALILPMKPNDSSDVGVPTKLLEYMACGKPILCCSSGESARIVRDAKCGLVIPPSDAVALAQAISELKASHTLDELGTNGRNFAEQNFSIQKIATKLETAFQYAISS